MDQTHKDFITNVIAGFMVSGIQVKGQRVAVVRDPTETKVGSIYLADEAQRKEPTGTIVALGKKVVAEDEVAVGDRIMYTKYAPIQFKVSLPDDSRVDVELFHVNDIYLEWTGDAVE